MPLYQSGSVVYISGSALVAQLPDSAVAGGNARGANAVDWQTSRTLAVHVASGSGATVGGGINNTASGANATVAGGSSNAVSANNSVIAGGVSNTSSGTTSAVAGGNGNTASGTSSWVPGGIQGTTRGLTGAGAWSAGRIAANGDSQAMAFQLSAQTTDATATRITSGSGAASAVNTINLPNFGVYAGRLTVTAKATATTDAATWNVEISAVRGATAATVVVFQGSGAAIAPTASNGTGSTWRLDIAADTTNGGIAVTGTGAAATTINWSASHIGPQATTAS